jgi:hypothetical protein
MQSKLDFTLFRIAIGIPVYLAMLGVVAMATYVLWAGPQRLGIPSATYAFWAGPQSLGVTETWPLVFYFVVPYLGTLLVAGGIIAVVRAGPALVRRML